MNMQGIYMIKNIEMELVERKVKKEEAEMKRKGTAYLSEEKALSKYKH